MGFNKIEKTTKKLTSTITNLQVSEAPKYCSKAIHSIWLKSPHVFDVSQSISPLMEKPKRN